jgi:O-antigen ligase
MMENTATIKESSLVKCYPLITFILVVLGYVTGLEVYTVFISSAFMAITVISTLDVKPLIFFVLTFMYQFSAQHLPMKPYYSDHYYSGHRLCLLIASAVIIILAVLIYLIKSKVLRFAAWRKIPLLIPLILFSASMVTNGLLTPGDDLMDLVWGLGQVLVYLVLYVMCFLGLRKEKRSELIAHFDQWVTLMSWIIILEVLWFIASGDKSFAEVVNSRSLSLGIGNCNIVGVHAAMLIPANIYGFMKGKRPALSIVTALFVYAVALVSTSRNAMLFGTFYFVLCFVICLFSGQRKRQMGKLVAAFAVFLAVFAIIFREEIVNVVELYLNRGMGDSGRYPLWERAFNAFLESPVFGKGFYTIDLMSANSFDKLSFDLVPDFAHNTVFELLAATGIVGFVGYSVYRIATFVLMLKKPSIDRVMLVISASYIVVASLLDNFILQIFSPVLYTVTMAIAAIIYDDDMEREARIFNAIPTLELL